MKRILLNDYYAVPYGEYCVLLETESHAEDFDIRNRIQAVSTYYEASHPEHQRPALPVLGELLASCFGFTVCEKQMFQDDIKQVLSEVLEWEISSVGINGTHYLYLDLQKRASKPEHLWETLLSDEIREQITKLAERCL